MLFEVLFTKDAQSRIAHLKPFIGKQVTAWCGFGANRNKTTPPFATAFSLSGTLEQRVPGEYRILVNDGNYCYFKEEDLLEIGSYGNKNFKDGSEAVIRVRFGDK